MNYCPFKKRTSSLHTIPVTALIKHITGIFFFLIVTSFFYTCSSQAHPATDDEFVGPFPSWINVKTQYGAVGDGVADETSAIQAAINAIGNLNSTASVVYLPAGTYRITGTLTMNSKSDVAIIGADPATTKIIWDGASGGIMLQVNGTAYSRFNRITWDGNNLATIAVDQSWNGTSGYFDTGNEYADDEFKKVGIGIRGGHLGYGFAETAIMRCKFTNNTTAGITLGNFNALDVWVWFSIFDNCAVGITNNNTTSSAGNFKVYSSIFRNSTTSDIVIGNTGEFAFRDNTSTNSQMFLKATLKTYPANITMQSNTIIDPVSSKAIDIQNQGPIVLLDNIIRSRAAATAPVVSHSPFPSGDFFAMGNTFTVNNAIQSTARNIIYDKAVVSAASLSGLTEPTLPGTQPNLSRTIFEVPASATAPVIQALINQAALLTGTRPIIHFAHGTYNISSTIMIPAGSDMQIVGDGHGGTNPTWIWWTGGSTGPVIKVFGPNKVTFRDIGINGNNLVADIVISDIDQLNSRVFMHEVESNLHTNGLLVNGLDNTLVLAYNSRISQTTGKAINVVGGPLAVSGNPLNGRTIFYGGLEWENSLSHEVTDGGNLLIRDVWYESQNNGPYLNLPGKGTFTVEGSSDASPRGTAAPQLSISNLSGKAAFVNNYFQDRMAISGSGSNTKVLGLGIIFGDNSLPVYPATTSYIENTTSPAGDIRSFNSRSHNNPNLATPRSGSYAVNNIGTADSTFIATMMASLRNVHAQVLTPTGNGISDIRFYRVWLYKGTTGLDIEGNSMSVLPVNFVSANVRCENTGTHLSWKMADEHGLKKYDIERNDGGTWNVISSVNISGNTGIEKNYSYLDNTNGGSSMYRIAAYDISGTKILSNVLKTSCTSNTFLVYPNPVKDAATVTVNTIEAAVIDMVVYDNKGAIIKKIQRNLFPGNNSLSIDMQGLPTGTYTVKAIWGNNLRVNKLVKIN